MKVLAGLLSSKAPLRLADGHLLPVASRTLPSVCDYIISSSYMTPGTGDEGPPIRPHFTVITLSQVLFPNAVTF